MKLLNGGKDYIREFLIRLEQLIETLYFCPKPMVAAINGHAIAGGCVIACCADHRLMVQITGRIGVPELRVGVPVSGYIMELLRARLSPASFEEAVLGGANYTADTALTKGLVDEVVSAEELMDRAMGYAQSLAAIAPKYFHFPNCRPGSPYENQPRHIITLPE